MKIRFANIADLPGIVDIYNQAIRSRCATGDMEKFGVDERIEWFEKFNNDEYPIYVAEVDNRVVGYCTLMSSVAEISYYLDYSFHGKGIGTA